MFWNALNTRALNLRKWRNIVTRKPCCRIIVSETLLSSRWFSPLGVHKKHFFNPRNEKCFWPGNNGAELFFSETLFSKMIPSNETFSDHETLFQNHCFGKHCFPRWSFPFSCVHEKHFFVSKKRKCFWSVFSETFRIYENMFLRAKLIIDYVGY